MSSSTNLSGEKEYESTLDISDSRPISTTSIKNKEQSVIVTAIPLGSNNNDLLEPSVENPVRDDTDIPFSVFTVNQRKMMVLTGSLAAIFSPISSSIYYPSLSSIAKDLHVSDAQISLTITLFLVIQGISPALIAGFSDRAGRRPAYIICFTVYICATLGLSLQNSYTALMILRCLQSMGSSATVALANGLVGDIITPAERGTYIAFASLDSALGPTIAPIIGGVLGQYAGWHWIFWFLFIFSVVVFIPLLLFLPETCRNVVDNGSIPPPFLSMNISDWLRHKNRKAAGLQVDVAKMEELRRNYTLRVPNPLATLSIIADKEAGIILFAAGLDLMCFFAISTAASKQFSEVYGLNQFKIALIFVAAGGGSIIAAFAIGPFLDWNYRRHAHKLGIPVRKNRDQDLTNFPIERVRIEVAAPALALVAITVIAYGWITTVKVNLAGPVIIMFISGFAVTFAFQVLSVLMVDIYPKAPATSTAANNIVRCELGAIATAAIVPMIEKIGSGWSFTFWALVFLIYCPALWVVVKKGMGWRAERADRDALVRRLKKERKERKENRN